MKEIKFLKTTQVMIFPSDDIYFQGLNIDSSIQKIQSSFSLSRVPMPTQIPFQIQSLIFQNGIFSIKNKPYVIEQLIIEERKIVINILSSSDISDLFFSELKNLIISLDQREYKAKCEPLICTYETTCISKINIDLSKLLSNIELPKIKELINISNDYDASISLIPSSIRFQVTYNNISEKLFKNKITIADKPLIIELREKTDPDDQIYYTVSPTDTETHLKLLEIIESMFIKGQSPSHN